MKASHQNFALNIAAGLIQTDAYLDAFPRCRSRDAARANASRLIAKDSIKAEINRIRTENETDSMLSYREKREFLARIVRNHSQWDLDVLKAIAVDNKMAGHDRPPTQEVGENTLEAILRDLQASPIVQLKPVAPLPIPAAGGGLESLPEASSTGNSNLLESGEGATPVKPVREAIDEGEGIKAFKERLARQRKSA